MLSLGGAAIAAPYMSTPFVGRGYDRATYASTIGLLVIYTRPIYK
jgi:hypothetical protein